MRSAERQHARPRSRRSLARVGEGLLVVLALGFGLSLCWQWLVVGTHRFYLENRPPAATSGAETARQRFEVRDGRVEPEIVASEGQRLTFPVVLSHPARLRLRAVPRDRATIEIALVEGGSRRTLYRRALSGEAEIHELVPPSTVAVELVNHGEVRWIDPRLVDQPGPTARFLFLLALLGLAGSWWWRGRLWSPSLAPAPWARTLLLGGVTSATSALVCLVTLEVGLRAMGSRLPPWIAVERRNLGEARADPRWQDSATYGPRLAPHVRALCQWEHGDIVRMGFIPPDLVRHPAYRFPLATDGDGFRNADAEPAPLHVAALGDSFTDALTLPAELTWPSRLGGLLRTNVRNYGTAGFGPGQELLVLKEYALPRKPRLVVVGFFAGNDLQDAERFERFLGSGGAFPPSGLGWKFKEVIARFDELYLTSLYQGASTFLRDRERSVAGAPEPHGAEDYTGEDPAATAAAGPAFDRGLFTVPAAGRTLRFAFLPPYLNALKLSRAKLAESPGWEATRRAYREMKRLTEMQGVPFVVLFIPSKAQVYLPLAESAFSPRELAQAVSVVLRDVADAPSVEMVMRNRLALNELMREFCATEGIPFLDLTAALEARLRTGSNVYFPDDSHWNAAGHETAAMSLAEWLPPPKQTRAEDPQRIATHGDRSR